jgi:hypothetical protein
MIYGKKYLTGLMLAMVVVFSCSRGPRSNGALHDRIHISETGYITRAECTLENFFTEAAEADSLLTDMVTYIGRKPPLATSLTRFEETFREYYIHYSREFRPIFFVITPDDTHYYYLSRPARSTRGNRRGVGGFFFMEDGQIRGFQELFNTYVMTGEELEEIGWTLFRSMVENGHVDDFIGNDQYIEWPDERLKYNKELFEWRYSDPG